jgi:hypothetical protein
MGEKAAQEALALWNRFPVNTHPRPIVIPIGPGIVYPPRDQREDLALYWARWKVSIDDRTMRIFFVGGPAGNKPCDDNYSGRVRESRHAVAFTITEFRAPAPANTICTLG